MVIATRGSETWKYESLMAAERATNISRKKISKACEYPNDNVQARVEGFAWSWFNPVRALTTPSPPLGGRILRSI